MTNYFWPVVVIFAVFTALLISLFIEGIMMHRQRNRELDDMAKQNDPRRKK